MQTIFGLDLLTPRDQLVVFVLKTLDDLGGASSKEEVISSIRAQGWFAFVPEEDWKPYPSTTERGSTEARWQTAIAWARQKAIELKLVDGTEWNYWKLERAGRDALRKIEEDFRTGKLAARVCCMWSSKFKAMIDPTYALGNDLPRPGTVYRDMEGFRSGRVGPRIRQKLLDDI